MSEKKKIEIEDKEEEKEEVKEEKEAQDNELEALRAENEKLKGDLEKLNDTYLRTVAEYENYRKRSQKEKDQVYGNAVSDTLTKLLDVLDAFDRASAYECTDEKYKQGIDFIAQSVKNTFDAIGVKEIPAMGEQFDPQYHNAMMHMDSDAYGENEITDVYKKGYMYGDKVIRCADVIVAN